MSRPEEQHPERIEDLHDPAFLAYLKEELGGAPIKPDSQDYDPSAMPTTAAQKAEQHRLAQAQKLIRLYREWKTQQN
jgi:hypothetical protein